MKDSFIISTIMLLIKSFIKQSGIHGMGCFTCEDIKKGEVVWKLHPELDLEITVDQLSSYPEAIQDFFKIYSYGQIRDSKKTLILCADHARHMNHSLNPNLIESGDGNAYNIAARDIAAGEELTCNYFDFDSDVQLKLRSDFKETT